MTWFVLAALAAVALYFTFLNAAIARGLPARGDTAPDFALPDQNGHIRSLGEFRGKWLVLYFYPRDDTPGCTEQAMRFRNTMRDGRIDEKSRHIGMAVRSGTKYIASRWIRARPIDLTRPG